MASPASAFQKEVQYMTIDGNVLDLICWNYYGRTNLVTETVFLRNRPVLSTYSAILPAGILVVLPEIDLPIAQGFQLWDYRQTQSYKAMAAQIADTEVQVQAALATYRARRTTVDMPVGTNPQIVNIGLRARIRATTDGAIIEVLGDDGIWYKQQGWQKAS